MWWIEICVYAFIIRNISVDKQRALEDRFVRAANDIISDNIYLSN